MDKDTNQIIIQREKDVSMLQEFRTTKRVCRKRSGVHFREIKSGKRKVAYSNVYQSKLTGNEIRYSEYNLHRS